MNNVKILVITTLLTLSLSSCLKNNEEATEETSTNEQGEMISRFVTQDVEVFDLLEEEDFVRFRRNGDVTADTSVSISPEISGKITDIKAAIGSRVKAGDLIAVLGDSLQISSLEIQNQTANDTLNIASQSENLLENQGDLNNENASIGAETSNLAYQNSIQSKNNTSQTLAEQKNSLELALENAEEAYDYNKKNYKQAKNSLEDAEEALDDYLDEIEDQERTAEQEQTIKTLEGQITAAKAQSDAAKFAVESADIGIKQSESALAQFNKTVTSQSDQLQFGVDSSYNQYLLSLNQQTASELATDQQLLNIQSQIAQARSSAEIAQINLDKRNLKSPVDGTITSINYKEGSLVSPGMTILTVEDLNNPIVKTAVTVEEKYFIKQGDTVNLKAGSQTTTGTITYISPSLDSKSKKFEVEIKLDNKEAISAGSLVEIEFLIKNRNRIFIPLNSIFILNGEKYVRVVGEFSKIEYKKVTDGIIFGEYVEIRDGLFGDEKIIKDQSQFLQKGEIVNPVK